MTRHTFENYEKGYNALLKSVKVKPAWVSAFKRVADRIKVHKEIYEEISDKVSGGKIPWEFIGVIHNLESGLNFNKHLHNGDPLTARTVRIPRGRPKTGNPPFSFIDSAVDALKMKDLDKIEDWSLARVAYELERYNGFGYRQFRINSPYLWSGTNHYVRGKYVTDGNFSRSAISQQAGAIPLFLYLRSGKATIDTKEIVNNSAKVKSYQKIINFFKFGVTSVSGLFGFDYFTGALDLIEKASNVIESQPLIFAVGGMIGFMYVYAEWLKHRTLQDIENGTYIPSGLKEDREFVDEVVIKAEEEENV